MELVYEFELEGQERYRFELSFDEQSFLLQPSPEVKLPGWTALEFHQCPHCPLSSQDYPQCPVAAVIAPVIEQCGHLISHSQVRLTVTTARRTIITQTTAQQALSSLLGLLVATSQCPHTVFFRPMAYFHLPVADEQETVMRVISNFLIQQYLGTPQGEKCDLDMHKLVDIYTNVQTINEQISKRIQLDKKGDAPANAVVILHLLSCKLPMSIDEDLEELRELYERLKD